MDLTEQSSLASPAFPASGPVEGDVLQRAEAALPQVEDEESYNMIEPPPFDWRSESSGDAAYPDDLDDPLAPPNLPGQGLEKASPSDPALLAVNTSEGLALLDVAGSVAEPIHGLMGLEEVVEAVEKVEGATAQVLNSDGEYQDMKSSTREAEVDRKSDDDDHNSIHSLLDQLQLMGEEPHPPYHRENEYSSSSQLDSSSPSLIVDDSTETTGLLFSESHHRDLLGMLQFTEISTAPQPQGGEVDAVVSVSYSDEDAQRFWQPYGNGRQQQHGGESLASAPDYEDAESVWRKQDAEHPEEEEETAAEGEQVSWWTLATIW